MTAGFVFRPMNNEDVPLEGMYAEYVPVRDRLMAMLDEAELGLELALSDYNRAYMDWCDREETVALERDLKWVVAEFHGVVDPMTYDPTATPTEEEIRRWRADDRDPEYPRVVDFCEELSDLSDLARDLYMLTYLTDEEVRERLNYVRKAKDIVKKIDSGIRWWDKK